MAVPVYTTDLTTLNTGEATTGWTEPTSATAGGIAVAETDRFIQGTGCISKTFNATGLGGMCYTNATAVTIPTDGAFFAWVDYTSPNATSDYTNGGQRLMIGSAIGAYKSWYVGGSDTNAYGGWKCYVANPTITSDLTIGTPTTDLIVFGYIVNSINAVGKGNPLGIDVIRYGRGQSLFTAGDITTPATFDGFATINDNVANRYGLIQNQGGSYLVQGLLQFGSSATAVYFAQSNRVLTIADNRKVTANFNTFEIQNAASYVKWNSVSVQALGTASKGRWITTDNADVNLNTCTFVDMNTFGFASNTTVIGSTFRRCGTITQNSSILTDCTFDSATSTTAVLSNNPTSISGCTFISNSNHAIELNSTGTYTLNNCTFSVYGANGTTSAAIYNNSGLSITLNISGGTIPTVLNSAGSSTTIVASNTVTLTGLQAGSEVRAYLGTNPSTSTEIDGVESSTTSFIFSQSYSGQAGYIQVFALGYLPIRLSITYESNNISIPIQQSIDRVYLNN